MRRTTTTTAKENRLRCTGCTDDGGCHDDGDHDDGEADDGHGDSGKK